MPYAIEDIARTFREARESKGLSQRALSERSGVRQYQISKFENGDVDLRLSSLVALARALDLELTLVPRKSLSAVNSIIRSSEPQGAAPPIFKELNRALDTVKKLRMAHPGQRELTKLQSSIQTIHNLPGMFSEEALREITRSVRELENQFEASRKPAEDYKLTDEQIEALRKANSAAQSLRNQLAHRIPAATPEQRPAYSLDEDDHG
jgi:transcriptional regulator with XRE-family HTH domain